MRLPADLIVRQTPWLAALGATVALALAASAAVRRHLAERRLETVQRDDLERAVRLAPGNSIAWARLGAVLERDGDTERAARALEQAVRLNPYNASAWVDLALHWEIEGDPARAERCLLEATRVDGGGATHWALANFYLRQGAPDRFWNAVRQILIRTRAGMEAAFDLCWRASGDPEEILRKAIPEDPVVLRRYFEFLLRTGRWAALGGAWSRVAPHLEPADRPAAIQYVDRLLDDGDVGAALGVWNAICRRGLLPYAPLDPAQGRLLTNADLRHAPVGRGFDWILLASEQIQAEVDGAGAHNSLKVYFSGTHPEAAELLWQRVPVEPGKIYRLGFRYRTQGLPEDTGLYWAVREQTAGQNSELAVTEPLRARDQWTGSAASFRARGATRLVRLVFAYRRSMGTTRDRGWIELAGLSLASVSEAAR